MLAHSFQRFGLGLAVLFFFPSWGQAQQRGRDRATNNRQESSATLPQDWANQIPWRNIGPANMGGRIVGLGANPQDTTQWWAASASGGLLKTTNNGVTFEHQFDSEATVSIGAFDISKSNPEILWIGTGEENPRNSSSFGDGVYKSTDGGATWTNMGLKKIFQTGAVSIHPTNPDVVFIGALGRLWGPSEDRGLYKTVDGGKTWKKVLYVDDRTGVIDIVIHPEDPNQMLAATYCRMRDGFDGNDPMVKFGEGAGIWRSTDGGESWQRITDGLPATEMGRIGLCYYDKDPNLVYAVIESKKIGQLPDTYPFLGVQGENAEVGARITEVTKDGPAAQAKLQVGDVIVRAGDTLVLSYQDLLAEIRKRKAGEKITIAFARNGKAEEIEVELALNPTVAERLEPNDEQGANEDSSEQEESAQDEEEEEEKPKSVNEQLDELRRGSPFAQSLGGQNPNVTDQQGDRGQDFGGVYRSSDGGVTWERINSLNPRPMYYSKIRVDPSDNNYIWVLGTQLYLSKDGGKTFSADGAGGEVHVDHHAMWIDPNDGRHVILGNDGGIYVTYDRGAHWDHLNHVTISQFYHVGVDTNRAYRVYGGLQDNGSWGGPSVVRNGSGPVNTDWFRIGGGDGFVCLVDPDDPDQLYYESQNGAMGSVNLRTGERGRIRPRPPRGTRYRFNWKTPFLLSPHNSEIHFSAGNYVFRSVKKGSDVQAISPEITRTDEGSGSAIGQSPRDENVLYVGTTDGALWATRDGGTTWNDLWKPSASSSSEAQEEGSDEDQARQQMRARMRGGRGIGRGGPGRGRGTAAAPSDPPSSDQSATDVQPAEVKPASEQPADIPPVDSSAEPTDESEAPAENMPAEATKDDESAPASNESDPPANEPSTDEAAKDEPTTDEPSDDESATEESETDTTNAEEPISEPTAEDSQSKADAPDDVKASKAEAENPPADTTDKPAAKPDPLAGTWAGQFESDMMPAERSNFRMALRRGDDGVYVGGYETSQSNGELSEGKFNAEAGTLRISGASAEANLAISATLKGDRLEGNFEINDGAFSIPFAAKRVNDATSLKAAAQDASDEGEDPGQPLAEVLPKPMWVSSIEPSRYVDGRCYVTIDGHRSDVDGPFVLVTENYGKSWQRLDGSLPEGTGSTRVIREDRENQNLLYLGTEFGFFISNDRGQSWTRIAANFPTVAVHEVAQPEAADEIVLGTHGRGVWIADVAALRQWTPEAIADDVVLYEPATVVRWRSEPQAGDSGTRRFVGENPSDDAHIYYSLGRDAREIELEIRDIRGRLIQRFEVDGSRGLHHVEWDLRRRSTATGGRRRFAPRVENGTYLVVLIVNGETYEQTIEIESDPEFATSGAAENEAAMLELMSASSEEDDQ